MNLLAWSEKLERLISKLPEPLRKPLLREITPVTDLFLRQRPPRLLLLGARDVGRADLINALFGCEVAQAGLQETGEGVWQAYSWEGRGTLQCLDARNPANSSRIKSSLRRESPDLIIFLQGAGGAILQESRDHSEKIGGLLADTKGAALPLVPVVGALIVPELPETDLREALGEFRQQLRSLPELNLIETVAFYAQQWKPPGELGDNSNRLAEAVAFALPNDAKLEMARLSGVRSAQVHIAQILIRSFTAASGAIGAQPIPLADFPILTSLQATMVAGIMVISGRQMTMKLAAEFIAALGANIGAAIFLREGARALLKLLPGWGNAISGAIASAGTYAIGKSATAYFIEGVSLVDARRLFRATKKSAIDKKRLGR